jgi:hypothetical protein
MLDLPRLRRQSGAVYVVAIYYAPGAGEPLTGALAEALDKTAYEARARLSDPEGGPAVVANYGEIEQAWACAGRLRANGIKPILLTPEDVESDAQRFVVRAFELGSQGLAATSRRGETAELAYSQIDLFLHAVRIDEQTELRTTERKKFSPGRALLTGGLMLSKTTRKLEKITTEERDELLLLYSDGRPPLVFHAADLNYQSLGPDLQPSTVANFAWLAQRLRDLTPRARHDVRLTSRAGRARVLGPSLKDRHLDVAISLLARVLRVKS